MSSDPRIPPSGDPFTSALAHPSPASLEKHLASSRSSLLTNSSPSRRGVNSRTGCSASAAGFASLARPRSATL